MTLSRGLTFPVSQAVSYGSVLEVPSAGGAGLNLNFTSAIPGAVTVVASPAGYARNSTGLTSFSANAGRRTNLGILSEPSVTNNVTNNVGFSGYSLNGGTRTAAATTGPDGVTVDGTKYLLDGITGVHGLYTLASSLPFSSSTQYTVSVYVKQGVGTFPCYIQWNVGNVTSACVAYYDLAAKTAAVGNDLIAGFTGKSAAILDLGNGWLLCTLTATTQASATNGELFFGPAGGLGPADSRSCVGDSTSYQYYWGLQYEPGAAATSPIVTGGTAVTRAVDNLTFTIPGGITTLTYTFDDNSTQGVGVSSGAYTIPTTLNRKQIKSIVGS